MRIPTLRPLPLLVLALFLAASPARAAFVLVTRTGMQLLANEPPRISGEMVTFYGYPNGAAYQMRVRNLDVLATERLNGFSLGLPADLMAEISARMFPAYTAMRAAASGPDSPLFDMVITNRELKLYQEGYSLGEIWGNLAGEPLEPRLILEPEPEEDAPSPDADEEAEWRARARVLREREDSLVRRRASLETQAESVRRAIAALGPTPSTALEKELARTSGEISDTDAALEAVRRLRSGLEAEARAAGVPDSWVR